jgi:hypothetical protein
MCAQAKRCSVLWLPIGIARDHHCNVISAAAIAKLVHLCFAASGRHFLFVYVVSWRVSFASINRYMK